MKYPPLDETVKRALNELTREEVSREVSYAYEHEILWYGIDAVAHTHLMNIARDIPNGNLSVEEFIEKYSVEFGSGSYSFLVSLDGIEADGIFIPQQRVHRAVNLFDVDYKNRLRRDSWVEKNYAGDLINITRWQPRYLKNSRLIEHGVKFGRDMWQTCVTGFDQTNKRHPQPQKVTDLGRELIKYYNGIVNAPSHLPESL